MTFFGSMMDTTSIDPLPESQTPLTKCWFNYECFARSKQLRKQPPPPSPEILQRIQRRYVLQKSHHKQAVQTHSTSSLDRPTAYIRTARGRASILRVADSNIFQNSLNSKPGGLQSSNSSVNSSSDILTTSSPELTVNDARVMSPNIILQSPVKIYETRNTPTTSFKIPTSPIKANGTRNMSPVRSRIVMSPVKVNDIGSATSRARRHSSTSGVTDDEAVPNHVESDGERTNVGRQRKTSPSQSPARFRQNHPNGTRNTSPVRSRIVKSPVKVNDIGIATSRTRFHSSTSGVTDDEAVPNHVESDGERANVGRQRKTSPSQSPARFRQNRPKPRLNAPEKTYSMVSDPDKFSHFLCNEVTPYPDALGEVSPTPQIQWNLTGSHIIELGTFTENMTMDMMKNLLHQFHETISDDDVEFQTSEPGLRTFRARMPDDNSMDECISNLDGVEIDADSPVSVRVVTNCGDVGS